MNRVALMGAGPGDPELLTRKAWRILGEADVVLYDALMDAPGMFELAPEAQWVPVGKRANQASVPQALICRMLVNYARQGLKVVRLKGGDPAVFGRLSEELEACRAAGIEVEIVPGVTAACAAAAQLQTSLTLRGVSRSLAFVTPRVNPHDDPDDSEWLQVSLAAQTVAIYMGGGQAALIAQRLLAAGKPPSTPVCAVENASLPGTQRAMTLSQLALAGLPALEGPVLLLMGEALASVLQQSAIAVAPDDAVVALGALPPVALQA